MSQSTFRTTPEAYVRVSNNPDPVNAVPPISGVTAPPDVAVNDDVVGVPSAEYPVVTVSPGNPPTAG
jgi:hypothetical protein